ncbi:MAG: hypothetical protein AB1Z29_22705, partial [Desulfobacterales bacterium]
FSLAGHDDSLLWMTDSYSMHVPGALNVANYLHGVEELKFTMGPHRKRRLKRSQMAVSPNIPSPPLKPAADMQNSS